MGDRIVAHLDAAVVLADRLDLLDLARWRCFEIALDVGMQRRLIVLHRQQVVGLGVEDRLGDVGIAIASIETRAPSSETCCTRYAATSPALITQFAP
jgi:hypothetical protein